MKILLLGSGGREHALAWKIAQSPKVEKLYIAPGNAGTANAGENVDIKADDFGRLKDFAVTNGVDMVVVGPEDPLVKGIYDDFKHDPRTAGIPVIGPSKLGAQLEGSKDFAKGFMQRHNIPTAKYKTFSGETLDEGLRFLETLQPPYVLKADGLCAGKGVLILPTLDEAKKELREMLGGMFGGASANVVIEEFLSGIECSVFVLTDGKNYKILPEAKDYKRIGEGDTGLNTGGMGSVTPVPFATKEWMQKVEDRIIRPTVEGLAAAAAFLFLRVVVFEAFLQAFAHVIKFRAVDVRQALGVYDHLDAVAFPDLIVVVDDVGKLKLVGHARAAARLDAQTQPDALAALGQKGGNVAGSRLRKSD